jgi:hypothetical protein
MVGLIDSSMRSLSFFRAIFRSLLLDLHKCQGRGGASGPLPNSPRPPQVFTFDSLSSGSDALLLRIFSSRLKNDLNASFLLVAKRSVSFGSISSFTRWVITNDGSISPASTLLSSVTANSAHLSAHFHREAFVHRSTERNLVEKSDI